MTLHDLKSWPDYFQAVVNGRKRFEIRRDDRPYKEGDVVLLREFIPDENAARAEAGKYDLLPSEVKVGYTGHTAGPFLIGHLDRGGCMPAGVCAFELVKLVPAGRPS